MGVQEAAELTLAPPYCVRASFRLDCTEVVVSVRQGSYITIYLLRSWGTWLYGTKLHARANLPFINVYVVMSALGVLPNGSIVWSVCLYLDKSILIPAMQYIGKGICNRVTQVVICDKKSSIVLS